MEIKDLKPAPYNPRMMKDNAKKGLRRSLKEFGDLSGIVFNKQTGNLVTGHHRLQELQGLYGENLSMAESEESGPFLFVNGPVDGTETIRFPIRVVEWPLEKEMAANVTANNTGIQGRFTDQLQPLLWKIKGAMNQTFADLQLNSMVKHAKSRVTEGEEEFSEVLNEVNQYVVLKFSNAVDWLNALTHFRLETKTSKRANGKEWSKGIGRVIDGSAYIRRATAGAMGEKE